MNLSKRIKHLLIFLIFFSATYSLHILHPIICGDMTAGLVNKLDSFESQYIEKNEIHHKVLRVDKLSLEYSLAPPMYSLNINENYRIPLRFSARHAGMDLALYKSLSEVIGPKHIHSLWHAFFRGLQGVLFYLIVCFFTSCKWQRMITLSCFFLMPISFFSYYVFITETVLHTFMLVVVYLLLRGDKYFKLAMFLTGFSMSIRPNFLWMAFSFVPMFWDSYKSRIRQAVGYIFLGFLPFLILLSLSDLLGEVSTVHRSLNPTELLKNAFSGIFLPKSYMKAFLAKGDLSNIWDYLVACALLILIFVQLLRAQKTKLMNNLFIGLFSSLLIIWIATRAEGNSVLYMFFLPPAFLLLVLEIFKGQSKWSFGLFGLLVAGQFVLFLSYYIPNGNKMLLDYNALELTTSKLEENGWTKDVVTIGTTDIGRLSYLSNGRIIPTNLFLLYNEMNSKSIAELLMAYGRSGTLVIPIYDDWSRWFISLGAIDRSRFEKELAKYNISIEHFLKQETRVGRGYYIIKYSLRD